MRYLAGLMVLLVCSADAFGDTLTVTSTSDAGPGSLRQAIADAAPGDTIDFAVTGTITLASRLFIDRNVRINGPGAALLTISGAANFAVGGVLTLTAGASEISGVTIAFGLANGCGGGIRVDSGATLLVTDSTLSTNGAFGDGGSICNHGGTTVIRCRIESSGASVRGGGVYNSGGMFIQDSTFSGNSSVHGGAIASTGPTILVRVAVTSNTAQFGGGIHGVSGFVDIRSSSITDNIAHHDGGGAWYQSGQINVINSTVAWNQASNGSGGGTFMASGNQLVLNSTYFNNFARLNGGGLYVVTGLASLSLTHATVAENRTLGTGGGLFSPNPVSGTNSLIVTNSILARSESFGGNCAVEGWALSGYNISDGGSCAALFPSATDRHFTPAGLDPLGLRDNGGPTKTIGLVPGSPAIDAVPVDHCRYIVQLTHDQRDMPRPAGPACDTGAFEGTLAPIDLTPPVLHVPADIVVDAMSSSGAVVVFDVTASDPDDAAGPVTCSPASGSVFPIGTTAVHCTATDTNGNTGSGGFSVTVLTPAQTITNLATGSLTAGLPQSTGLLQNVLAGLSSGNLGSACNQLRAFENHVRAQAGKSVSETSAASLLASAGNVEASLGCR